MCFKLRTISTLIKKEVKYNVKTANKKLGDGDRILVGTSVAVFRVDSWQWFKDAMPVSFRSILFTSYILTIFKQRNILS